MAVRLLFLALGLTMVMGTAEALQIPTEFIPPARPLAINNTLASTLLQLVPPNTLYTQKAVLNSSELPLDRVWHAATMISVSQDSPPFDYMVMFGGLGTAPDSLPLSEVSGETWIYNVGYDNRQPRWWTLPESILSNDYSVSVPARCGHAMATFSTVSTTIGVLEATAAVMFGGTSYVTSVFPQSETLLPSDLFVFNVAALGTLNNTMYQQLYNSGVLYGDQRLQYAMWYSVQTLLAPPERKFHSLTTLMVGSTEVGILFGGATLAANQSACLADCVALGDTWVLQLQASNNQVIGFVASWKPVSPKTSPSPRYGHAVTAYAGELFLAGGTAGLAGGLDDVWTLSGDSIDSLEWRALSSKLPGPYIFSTLGILQGDGGQNLVMVGGADTLVSPFAPKGGPEAQVPQKVFASALQQIALCQLTPTSQSPLTFGCVNDNFIVGSISTPPSTALGYSYQGLFGATMCRGKFTFDSASNAAEESLLVYGGASTHDGEIYPRGDVYTVNFQSFGFQFSWQAPVIGPRPLSQGKLAATRARLDNQWQFSLWLLGGITQDATTQSQLWRLSAEPNGVIWHGVSVYNQPVGRYAHTFTTLEGPGVDAARIVAFGGIAAPATTSTPACNHNTKPSCTACQLGSYQLLSDAWLFSAAYYVWTAINITGPTPACRAYHEAVAINDKLFIFGGVTSVATDMSYEFEDDFYPMLESCSGSCKRRVLGDLWVLHLSSVTVGAQGVFETVTASWQQLHPSQPIPPRFQFAMATVGNTILLYGGKAYQDESGNADVVVSQDVWTFELESTSDSSVSIGPAKQLSDSPGPRWGHSCVGLGTTKVACSTGWSVSSDNVRTWARLVYIYSLDTDTWAPWEDSQIAAGLALTAATGIATNDTALLLSFGGLQQGAYSFSNPFFTSFSLQCPSGQGVSKACYESLSYQGAYVFDCPCEICPLGTYGTLRELSCTECPEDSWTSAIGATSLDACAACNPSACNGHGECQLSGHTAQCTCGFGWSGVHCEKNYSIPVGILIALSVIGVILGTWLWRRSNRRQVAKLEGTIAMLNETLRENVELKTVWEINHAELQFSHRIDDDVGSSGEVWAAEWRDVTVAVKILRSSLLGIDESSRILFEREVSFMRKLRDQNLVLFQGAGYMNDPVQGNIPFIVLEYCSKGSWHRQLHQVDDKPSWMQRLQWAIEAAQGMRFLHGLQPTRLHRDFKPHNCLISQSNVLKVADLGSISTQGDDRIAATWEVVDAQDALARQDAYRTVKDPQQGRPVGTPAYLAPEAFNTGEYTTKCDVFSYAVSMCENLTCMRPFSDVKKGGSLPVQIAGGLRPSYVTPAPLDAEALSIQGYVAVMEMAWQVDPSKRPSFAQVCSALGLVMQALQ